MSGGAACHDAACHDAMGLYELYGEACTDLVHLKLGSVCCSSKYPLLSSVYPIKMRGKVIVCFLSFYGSSLKLGSSLKNSTLLLKRSTSCVCAGLPLCDWFPPHPFSFYAFDKRLDVHGRVNLILVPVAIPDSVLSNTCGT